MKKKEKDLIDLNLRQRKFLDLYFKTGNATQSYMEVYKVKDVEVAAVNASRLLSNAKVSLRALIEKKGLGLGDLIDVLKEGIKATRTVSAQILVKENGGVLKKEDEGIIEVPDYRVRHDYIRTAAKWLGVEEEQTEGTKIAVGVQVPVSIEGKEVDDEQLARRIIGIVERLKSVREGKDKGDDRGSGQATTGEGNRQSE